LLPLLNDKQFTVMIHFNPLAGAVLLENVIYPFPAFLNIKGFWNVLRAGVVA
jgi:hypothetical protein